MKQSSYDTIVKCIQYGAAAISTDLINDLNTVVNNSNELINQKVKAEQEAKQVKQEESANKDGQINKKK